MRAICSTNFGEHSRNFMVNLNVKCMNHCMPDFSSFFIVCYKHFYTFFLNIYEQAVPGIFF
jgi:hypothetical protein